MNASFALNFSFSILFHLEKNSIHLAHFIWSIYMVKSHTQYFAILALSLLLFMLLYILSLHYSSFGGGVTL